MVAQFGYAPVSVDNGADAISLYDEFQPDIVLLDVIMPGLKGDEVATRLKQFAGQVHLPIIFITALDDKRTLLRCLEAGGDDFISKPFDPLILSAKLRAHMRTRNLSQKLEEKNQRLAYFNSKTEREYRIVQYIFNNALNKNLPDYPFVNSLFKPLSEFNGDVLLTARGPLGNLYVFLGDFTGHGLAAAIGTLPTSQTFFTMTSRGSSITEIVREINKGLKQLLPEDMFCAAVIMEQSASGERISYWNGGMTPPILLNHDHVVERQLSPQHVALGILDNDVFESGISSFAVSLGSQVIMSTDGLTEFMGRTGHMLGFEGILNLFEKHDYSFASVSQEIETMTTNTKQRDDITLAVIECQPTNMHLSPEEESLSTMPFEFSIKLNVEQIRQHDPVTNILRGFKVVEGFSTHTTPIFTLMSEVYVNAIDHGLLKLDSSLKDTFDGFESYYFEREERLAKLEDGFVVIKVEYKPEQKRLYFEVKNSGEGFSPSAVNQFRMSNELSFGRGLTLVEELADEIEWFEDGRAIRVTYHLESPAS